MGSVLPARERPAQTSQEPDTQSRCVENSHRWILPVLCHNTWVQGRRNQGTSGGPDTGTGLLASITAVENTPSLD